MEQKVKQYTMRSPPREFVLFKFFVKLVRVGAIPTDPKWQGNVLVEL